MTDAAFREAVEALIDGVVNSPQDESETTALRARVLALYAALGSRLLAAEAERDKWERISHGHFERAEKAEAKNHDDAVALADKMCAERARACEEMWGQILTLRAEREALVPLARLGLWAYDEHQSGGGLWDDEFRDKSFMLGIHVGFGRESEATTQARAILAREET